MGQRRTKNLSLSLVWFFLKTFLFNPLNNPIFVVIIIFIIFFCLGRSLDKYHVALILYLAILGHYFIGNMFKDSVNAKEETSKVPIMRYFQALPISGRKIYFSYLLSTAIYVLSTYVLIGFLLMELMRLPDLKNIQFIKSVTPDGDTITTLTGFGLTPRGIPQFVSIDLKKSLLFDPISKIGGGYIWLTLCYILAFIYISVFQVFKQFNPTSRSYLVKLFHRLPLGIYLLLGLAFATELILSQKEIGICTGFVLRHLDLMISLSLVIIVGTSLSIVLMSRSILSELKVID